MSGGKRCEGGYTQFNDVAEDLAAPWAMALWKRVPTPAAARGTRLSTYDKLLNKHRIRRIDTATLKTRLAQPPLDVDPAAARAAQTHVRLLAKRLAVVNEQIAEAGARIDERLAELGGADPGPCAADAPAGGPRDATVLRSITGVGRMVLATLLAEADDVLARRDYAALRGLCGTAPVTKQSGRMRIVTRRLAVHGRLRDAVQHWARVAVQHDAACAAKYRALRGRGHGHHRALRSVADGLLRTACAMLRDGTLFDPQYAPTTRHREATQTRSLESSQKSTCRKANSPTASKSPVPSQPRPDVFHASSEPGGRRDADAIPGEPRLAARHAGGPPALPARTNAAPCSLRGVDHVNYVK